MIEVKIPALGESISTARIAKLLVAAGDMVKRDDNICLLDTEKISLEVTASEDGVLTAWQVKEGDDVAVGTVIATIDDKAKSGDDKVQSGSDNAGPPPVVQDAKSSKNDDDKVKSGSDNAGPPPNMQGGKSSQNVQMMQDSEKLQTDSPSPTASTKNLSTTDSTKDSTKDSTPVHVSDERGEERVKMSKLREAIARRLKSAQTNAAILTTFNEVDMSMLIEMRQLHRDEFQRQHDTKLGFMSFFIKAVCAGLKDFPIINASIDGNDIIYKNYYDIGIAVGSPTGLVVPVLRDADQQSFVDIERAIGDFSKRAESGQLTLKDLTGGSFTITNGGIFGSMLSTPIINPPQSAILGMHKIEKRAVVKNDMITIAPVMYIALSYDHRIIDGREAVSFLTKVKSLLERPEGLLLGL